MEIKQSTFHELGDSTDRLIVSINHSMETLDAVAAGITQVKQGLQFMEQYVMQQKQLLLRVIIEAPFPQPKPPKQPQEEEETTEEEEEQKFEERKKSSSTTKTTKRQQRFSQQQSQSHQQHQNLTHTSRTKSSSRSPRRRITNTPTSLRRP